MSKYTFIKQPEDDNWLEEGDSKLTFEFNAVSLDRLLEEFELFLKGSGFVFDGRLDITQDENFFEDLSNDDLDDLDQWFGSAKEKAKKLDEIAIMKADVSPKTRDPWPFPTEYVKEEVYTGFGYSGKPVITPQTDDE
jgi:hypothetical protein